MKDGRKNRWFKIGKIAGKILSLHKEHNVIDDNTKLQIARNGVASIVVKDNDEEGNYKLVFFYRA